MVPPWSVMWAARALGNALDPPTGVAQPQASRPAMIAAGSAPVPGRCGGCIVAKAIQAITWRNTGCWNVEATTSHALRRRNRS